jgi:hypothetical protein
VRLSSSHFTTASSSLARSTVQNSLVGSEIAQTLDAITGSQFRVGRRGPNERWPLGAIQELRMRVIREVAETCAV